MAASSADRLFGVAVKKRVRKRQFGAFGDMLVEWRGEMEIETAVRFVRNLGVSFNGSTLRGWEYGWSGRPDPIRLLALAQVYRKSSADVLKALAAARGIALSSDLLRPAVGVQEPLRPGGATDETPPRIQPHQPTARDAAFAEEIQTVVNHLASVRLALLEGRTPARTKAGRSRRHRKAG